jgi:hypothetical protein
MDGIHWTRTGGQDTKAIFYLWEPIKKRLDTGDALKEQKMRQVK